MIFIPSFTILRNAIMLASHNFMEANMTEKLRIVWGARAIGEVIGRTERQTHYLLEQGAIRAARKIGSQWCTSVPGLRAQFCHTADERDNAA